MRKLVFIIFISLMITSTSFVLAQEDIKVFLNNKSIVFDVSPIIENGRTLVPLRAIFEALNATIDWDGSTKTVTATKGEKIIKIQIGNEKALIDGVENTLDVPAKIINGRTLVPLRFVSESFGTDVVWDGEKRHIFITKDFISKLVVHFIDVGQADSILIETPTNSMLIDAGNNGDGDLVLDYLKSQDIKKLDYVIGTHPHEDHIGGLDDVIDNFEIGKVIMPRVTHTTETFKDVLVAVKNKGLKISSPEINIDRNLGEATFKMLSPNNSHYEELNDYSVTVKLSHGNNDFLFMGDAEELVENEILNKGFDISAEVLKFGHHGSSSSTCWNFLNRVNPKFGVITVGSDNKYGHPHKEILSRIKAKGIKVYRTDENGTVVVTSDGESLSFESSKYIEEPIEKATPVENISMTSSKVIISSLDKKGEIIKIKNTSNSDIDLNGWRIVSVRGAQKYLIQNYILKANETVSVASAGAEGDLNWGKGNIWNNSKSDPAELYDASGNLIFRYDN